ncbi:hypothetical protein BRUCa_1263 [Brucella melitensis]|nr:hypothetical protein BM28_A1281 [Brucella melitensis M28]AEW14981.1 hypothetical protein BCA52141_I3154 [Brucella canis HSK A52141]AEW17576.1 hypothetical protein BAA13334_I01953 [Brucella abortus A13334]AIB18004.1 Hypothetical protein BSSP3_I1290 [Brucella suis bv. 2]AIB20539.1 Hypothetical protein BSPT1_I0434 [Brucella suis bv. 2]
MFHSEEKTLCCHWSLKTQKPAFFNDEIKVSFPAPSHAQPID